MGLDVYVLGALAGCLVCLGLFRLGNELMGVWWPESGDGGDELAGGEPRG